MNLQVGFVCLIVLLFVNDAQAIPFLLTASNSSFSSPATSISSTALVAEFSCSTTYLIADYTIKPYDGASGYDAFKFVVLSTMSSSPFSVTSWLATGSSNSNGHSVTGSAETTSNTAFLYFECSNEVFSCTPSFQLSLSCTNISPPTSPPTSPPASNSLIGAGLPSSESGASYLIVVEYSDADCTQLPSSIYITSSGTCTNAWGLGFSKATYSAASGYSSSLNCPDDTCTGNCPYTFATPYSQCNLVNDQVSFELYAIAPNSLNLNLYSDNACSQGQQQQTASANTCSQMPSIFSGSQNYFAASSISGVTSLGLFYNCVSGCGDSCLNFIVASANQCTSLGNGQSVKLVAVAVATPTAVPKSASAPTLVPKILLVISIIVAFALVV